MKARSSHLSLPFSLAVKRAGRKVKIPLGGSGVGLHDALRHVLWAGSWKAQVLERLVPGDGPVVIDVGVNTGQTLLEVFITHPNATYLGFEPIPACAAYASRLIHANGWQTATVIATALAANEGVIPLYRHAEAPADSAATTLQDLRPGLAFDVDWVPCLRFDTVKATLRLAPIDLIKIDVEGSELEVVKGMEETLSSSRPVILCEVLFTDSAADIEATTRRNEELMRRLTAAGYRVWQLIKSADLKTVQSVRPVQEFPREYWTPANAELCDYLFLPEEKYRDFFW